MRSLVFQALLLALVVFGVMAIVFRSQRAWRAIHLVRDGVLIYVVLLLALSLFRAWQDGGL